MAQSDASNTSSRDRILAAATRHFAERGFDGARTQAIADEAGINKAMLYYHFRGKEHLYQETLIHNFLGLFQQVFPLFLQRDHPAGERLLAITELYHRFMDANPQVRSIMLRELAAGGEHLKPIVERVLGSIPGLDGPRAMGEVSWMMEQGEIREGDPRQVFLHIISLTIFPYAARPLLEILWDLEPGEFDAIIARRPAAIADLITHGLIVDQEGT
jgi:AcrR family transcriptional regulator